MKFQKVLLLVLTLLFTLGCQAQTPKNFQKVSTISVGKAPNKLFYDLFFPTTGGDGLLADEYTKLIDTNDFLLWTSQASQNPKPASPGEGAPTKVSDALKFKLQGMQAVSPAGKIGEDYWVQFFTQGSTAWTAVFDTKAGQVVLLQMKA